MKVTVKPLLLLLSVLFLLPGCSLGGGKPDNPEQYTSEDHSSDPQITSDEPSQDPAGLKEADSHEGKLRSRLTNEWIDKELAQSRPIAVMIPNEAHAVPHYNLSEASVLYETKVEGSMTRLMAIYEDWRGLKKIGNVRSLRSYFAYWAFEWDSIIVHYGGPYFINELISQDFVDTIDGTRDSTAFFRVSDRIAPHNAYASGSGIEAAIEKAGFEKTNRNLTEDIHFHFASEDKPNTLSQYGDAAEDASYVDMTAAFPLTRCYFQYDPKDGLYYRYQYLSGGVDGPHVDGFTGKTLSFSNLLVQHIKQEDIGDGYLAMQCHDSTKDGWFFTRGKGIHVTWEKTGDFNATRFYDDNGKEIVLNTGKTMILIIKDSDSFTYR